MYILFLFNRKIGSAFPIKEKRHFVSVLHTNASERCPKVTAFGATSNQIHRE